jgi:hypothetical protein
MADRVACEAREGDDAQRNVALADRMQREQIVADEIAVTRDHQRAGDKDTPWRLCLERGDDFVHLDVVQQMVEDGRGDNHNSNADHDADPASAAVAADRPCK